MLAAIRAMGRGRPGPVKGTVRAGETLLTMLTRHQLTADQWATTLLLNPAHVSLDRADFVAVGVELILPAGAVAARRRRRPRRSLPWDSPRRSLSWDSRQWHRRPWQIEAARRAGRPAETTTGQHASATAERSAGADWTWPTRGGTPWSGSPRKLRPIPLKTAL